MINDILDFSKIEAGKLEIDSAAMSLRNTIEDVAIMLGPQAAAQEVELVVNIDPAIPAVVRGDAQRLRQCLVNLVGNALRFTRAGEVVIGAQLLKVHDAALVMRFEVRDTGIGIPAATLRTLFQPFVQADVSTTRDYGGTGLGLSIVRRLVEMMGGEVGVESTVGVGSMFWFTLPVVAASTDELEQQAPMHDSVVAADGRRARVLVVDDNRALLESFRQELQHAGYDVVAASDADTALHAARTAAATGASFDLALLDRQLPDDASQRLLDALLGDSGLSTIPRVGLSSMSRAGAATATPDGNLVGTLTKPTRARDLLRVVGRAIAGSSIENFVRTQPLSIGAAHASTSRHAPSATVLPAGYSVLLVEDQIVNQKVAARFIERLACKVTLARNGEEAIAPWQATAPDIVLMDLQMPVMDGLTATRKIRLLEQAAGTSGTHVPIVALTANAMDGQLERCLAAGMDAFLTKPIDATQLRQMLLRFTYPEAAQDAAAEPLSLSA